MILSTSEKIKIICDRLGITYSELADRLNISIQNLSNKLSRNNFKEEDLKEIAKALGCEFESNFIMEDGTKV
ncbi:MAG: helix-turn-helix transcriptional regulator [Clostridiales bacterium]|nr:helix-turn-helix transcriptional regulator [Clostridiales bacterium]